MKKRIIAGILAVAVQGVMAAQPAPNGIPYPTGWQNWKVIAVSHREDNHTLRVILGNDKAVEAARKGQTNPWPDGAALGKVVWKDTQAEHWKKATVPGKFVHAEFMFKDSHKWKDTGGWGWARWVGTEQKPFGKNARFDREVCMSCHTPVKNNDWVFTKPAVLPAMR